MLKSPFRPSWKLLICLLTGKPHRNEVFFPCHGASTIYFKTRAKTQTHCVHLGGSRWSLSVFEWPRSKEGIAGSVTLWLSDTMPDMPDMSDVPDMADTSVETSFVKAHAVIKQQMRGRHVTQTATLLDPYFPRFQCLGEKKPIKGSKKIRRPNGRKGRGKYGGGRVGGMLSNGKRSRAEQRFPLATWHTAALSRWAPEHIRSDGCWATCEGLSASLLEQICCYKHRWRLCRCRARARARARNLIWLAWWSRQWRQLRINLFRLN